ncbi:MAG: EamA family transporter, partial [Aliarcobacter butzleri]
FLLEGQTISFGVFLGILLSAFATIIILRQK